MESTPEDHDDPLAPFLPRITNSLRDSIRSRSPNRAIPRALAFLRALVALGERVADGWITWATLAEIAQAAQQGYNTARRAIDDLRDAGIVITRGKASGGERLEYRVRLEILTGETHVGAPTLYLGAPTFPAGGVRGGARSKDLSSERVSEREKIVNKLPHSLPQRACQVGAPTFDLLPGSIDDPQATKLQLAADVAAWCETTGEPAEIVLAAVLLARSKKPGSFDRYIATCVDRHRNGSREIDGQWIRQASRALERAKAATRSAPPAVVHPDEKTPADAPPDLEASFGAELDAMPVDQVHELTSQIPLQFARDYCGGKGPAARDNTMCRSELLKLLAANSLTSKETQ
jgi:flavin-binding protein dodecin